MDGEALRGTRFEASRVKMKNLERSRLPLASHMKMAGTNKGTAWSDRWGRCPSPAAHLPPSSRIFVHLSCGWSARPPPRRVWCRGWPGWPPPWTPWTATTTRALAVAPGPLYRGPAIVCLTSKRRIVNTLNLPQFLGGKRVNGSHDFRV